MFIWREIDVFSHLYLFNKQFLIYSNNNCRVLHSKNGLWQLSIILIRVLEWFNFILSKTKAVSRVSIELKFKNIWICDGIFHSSMWKWFL